MVGQPIHTLKHSYPLPSPTTQVLYPLCNANFKRAFKQMLGLTPHSNSSNNNNNVGRGGGGGGGGWASVVRTENNPGHRG